MKKVFALLLVSRHDFRLSFQRAELGIAPSEESSLHITTDSLSTHKHSAHGHLSDNTSMS